MTQESKATFTSTPEAGAAALQMWLETGNSLITGLTAAQAEYARFWHARLDRLRETADRVTACRDPKEAVQLQAEHAQAMMRDYAELWPRLMGVLVDTVRAPAVSAAASAVHEQKLQTAKMRDLSPAA